GDPDALARIQPTDPERIWWPAILAREIALPNAWTEEDRRAMVVLATAGFHDQIGAWLNAVLDKEKADEDFHGFLRAELAARDVAESLIASLTVRRVVNYTRGRRPNSAGR